MDRSIRSARRAAAERLAAFAFAFAGCGAAVTNADYDNAAGAVGVRLVFGVIIMAITVAAASES